MKNNKLQSLIFALAGILALTSCSNDDKRENNPQAIRFTGGIGIQSEIIPLGRASGATWNNDDAIGIFMVDHGQTEIAENAANRQFTTDGSGSFTPVAGDEIYFPMDASRKVDFIAYYPHEAGVTLDSEIGISTADQSVPSSFDLLWAKADNDDAGYDKENPDAIPLTFDHKLARLTMNCKADAGVGATSLDGMTVVVRGMNTKTTFAVKDGTLGTPAIVADIATREIAPADGFLFSCDAIILPCSYAKGTVKVEFTINGEVYTWDMEQVDFTAGYDHVYEVILYRTGVKATGTINPWNSVVNDNPVYAK